MEEQIKDLCDEAQVLVVRLLPPEEYGEDYEAERLYEILDEIKILLSNKCK